MDELEVQQKVRAYLKETIAGDPIDAARVNHVVSRSPKFVRTNIRKRGLSANKQEIIENAPDEHRFIYSYIEHGEDDVQIEHFIIVTTDGTGNIEDIIESK